MNAKYATQEKKGDLVLLGGQILFNETDSTSAFHLLAGEVVIIRHGQVVDLVETGERIDAAIWNGGTAVAWTDCVLQTVNLQPPTLAQDVHPAVIDKHLALAA